MNKKLMAVGLLSILILGGGAAMVATRGVRNNNPLNIRKGDNWEGMKSEQTDKSFVQFVSPEWGFRAGYRILQSYKKRGIDTVSEIIETWAPPSENDTEHYIKFVNEGMARTFDWFDIAESEYPRLMQLMAKMETGEVYPLEVIEAGIALADKTYKV